MILCGNLFGVLHGPWDSITPKFIALYGILGYLYRYFMVLCGSLWYFWVFMVFWGTSVLCGSCWYCMYLLGSFGPSGYFNVLQVFWDTSWLLHGTLGQFVVLGGYSRSSGLLHDSLGYFLSLCGTSWYFMVITRYLMVLFVVNSLY